MSPLPHPRFALIADRFTEPAQADRAVAAVRGGVRWVHLRDHTVSVDTFASAAAALTARLRATADAVTVTVNAQMEVAEQLGTGLHVGWRGPSVAQARATLGEDALIGYSAHEEVEATGDRARGRDYYFYSPVFATDSKPDQPPAGIGALRSFCEAAAPTPVFALGGITPDRVEACRAAGAEGVAVLSGIMEADAPAAATRAYLRALSGAAT
ncbi:MAG: thiamine phosphate synthase [Salinibacter sp.]